jgi:ABC-type branched-subunit amino acid transport system ATPase component
LGAATTEAAPIFDLFAVLKKWRWRGGDLSGGHQRQLAMGRALVLEPKLPILDEPSEGFSPTLSAKSATSS